MKIAEINRIEQEFQNSSIAVYSKDRDGRYLNVNDKFFSGSYNALTYDQIIRQRDIDLWEDDATLFSTNDQEVRFKNQKGCYLETNNYQGHQQFYLSSKIPIHSKTGKVIGILGFSIMQNPIHSNQVSSLDDVVKVLTQFMDTPLLGSHELPHNQYLSCRQNQCLYYLAQGMTIKQIANQLKLSPRTVENYMNAIKVKLNCSSRYELTQKAIQFQEDHYINLLC